MRVNQVGFAQRRLVAIVVDDDFPGETEGVGVFQFHGEDDQIGFHASLRTLDRGGSERDPEGGRAAETGGGVDLDFWEQRGRCPNERPVIEDRKDEIRRPDPVVVVYLGVPDKPYPVVGGNPRSSQLLGVQPEDTLVGVHEGIRGNFDA